MRLSPTLRRCVGLVLCALCGCAMPARGGSWNLLSAVPLSESEPPDASDDNPFRKAEPEPRPKIARAGATAETASRSGASKSAVVTADFDDDIRRMIDDELQDATPEERTYWLNHLENVQPSAVPEILKARRLSTRFREQQAQREQRIQQLSAAAAEGESSTETPPAARWGHSGGRPQAEAVPASPAGTRQTSAPSAGMGVASPWGSETLATRPSRPQDQADSAWPGARPPATMGDAPMGFRQAALYPPGTSSPSPAQPPGTFAAGPDGTPVPGNFGPQYQPVGVPQFGPGGMPGPGGDASGADLVRIDVEAVTYPGRYEGPAPPQGGAGYPGGWAADLQRLIAQVEADVAALPPAASAQEHHETIRRQVYLRMLYLMDEHQERALTAIPGIEPADQEFWQQMFWAISNYFDTQHIPDGNERATQTIAQLNAAVRRLQEKARLELRNVAFCHKIASFGNYDKFPRDEFSPGQDVLLYAEVENFKSELAADGQHATLLRSTIEILSPSGEVRKSIDFKATEDLCRNYRRDYFHSYQFAIPQNVPLGPHVLKLTVFDELSGKMASYSQNFLVK